MIMIPPKYFAFLEAVTLCRTSAERRIVLSVLCRDPKFIKAVKVICALTYQNAKNLTSHQKQQLKRFATVIEHLAKTLRLPKAKVIQHGGGLIAALLPIVASLVGSTINGART